MAKKRKLNIPVLIEKLTAEQLRMVNNYFRDCVRIGAVRARFYKKTKNRVEVYDIGNKSYVGAIYPDSACMIWPRDWYYSNKDVVALSEDDAPFNAMLNDHSASACNNKRVQLCVDSVRATKVALKRERAILYG